MLLESIFEVDWYTKVRDLPNCEKAREYLRQKWADAEDEDLVVIKVEGYHCLTKVVSEFWPYEICDVVFPFDRVRIYPMQEIERKIYFKP